jgi:hypothetical protein
VFSGEDIAGILKGGIWLMEFKNLLPEQDYIVHE